MKRDKTCGECAYCEEFTNIETGEESLVCMKADKKITDLWGKIPKWCPLENKGAKI